MPGMAPCLLSRENRVAIFKCPPPSCPPSSCSPGTAEPVGRRNPTSLCRATPPAPPPLVFGVLLGSLLSRASSSPVRSHLGCIVGWEGGTPFLGAMLPPGRG